MGGSGNVSAIIHLLLSNWKIISKIRYYTENWPRNGSVWATILRFVSALSSSNNISSLLCQNTFVANIWTRTQSLLKQQKYLPWGSRCDFYYRHTTKHWRSIKSQYCFQCSLGSRFQENKYFLKIAFKWYIME